MVRLPHWVFGTLLLVLSAPLTFAESLLNGLAVHQEFNKEQFIGALYTETLSADAATQLNDSGSKRLELRVIADRLSTRQLNSMWIEGMAVNNPPDLLTSQAQHMVTFTGFVQRSLRAGDVLAIRGDAKRTSVSLNNVELGHVESPEFFKMVLRTWIGNVPLSSSFRDQLLTNGDVNPELLAQFESLQPSASRVQAIASWSQPEQPATEPATQDAPAVAAAGPTAAPEIAPPVALVAPVEVQVAKPVLAAAPPAEPEPKPDAAPASKPAAGPPAPAAQVAQATPAPAPQAAEDEFEEDEEDSAPLLTAESLLGRQMYHSQLLRWTYQNINYPKRAISRGHEGSVRLAVVIDRQGNVKNVVEVETSPYESLNREALRAVERATPFPAIPDTVQGEEFAFSLPIQFKLPE